MSVGFGFSVSDIISSYKLAHAICENCFTKAQAADVKYIRFRQEIHSLGESLERLETIVNNADIQSTRRPWHSDREHYGEALQLLPEVTGDFHKTLKDCERLLQDHARLQYGRPSVSDNFAWWTSTERDVDNLRERVNFHITKVSFIAKPFEIQLLLQIRRELRSLRNDVADIRGILTNGLGQSNDASNASYLQSIRISDDLAARFTAALETNRPLALLQIHDWPVKEGFDAVVFHFAKSTVEFTSNRRLGQNVPDPYQYLNLLKSIWAMKQLKASPSFCSIAGESLWADYMRELEVDMKHQFFRFDSGQLARPSSLDLLQLPNEYFTIWVDEEPLLHLPDMVEQRPLEEKILELALPQSYGNRQMSLTIFRSSDYEFRLVRTTKMTDNPMYHSEEGSSVNMNYTRFIPVYASPDNTASAANNILLCNDTGQQKEWHMLQNASDVTALQRALTGYRIHHDMSGFTWCINGSNVAGDSGVGRLQLWQLKPLARIAADNEPKALDRGLSASTLATVTASQTESQTQPSHRRDTFSTTATYEELKSAQLDSPGSDKRRRSTQSSIATKSKAQNSDSNSIGTSRTTLVSGSSITATVNGPQSDGVELMRPEVPVLVIFTMCKGKYTILHLKLEQDVFVNPKSCACTKPKRACKRVVLESKTRPFVVHRFSVNEQDERRLFSFDLGLFRYPHRPEYKDIEVVERMKYLDLEFSSVEAKDTFISELTQLENHRNMNYNDYVKLLRDRTRRAMS